MSLNKIPLRQLGRNGPYVSALGLGTMGNFLAIFEFSDQL